MYEVNHNIPHKSHYFGDIFDEFIDREVNGFIYSDKCIKIIAEVNVFFT